MKERKATKLEVFSMESNMKTPHGIVLCLTEMAYPLSWNICSSIDNILPTSDDHVHIHRRKKGVEREGLTHLAGLTKKF